MNIDLIVSAAFLGLSLITRFAFLNYPREAVLEEHLFGQQVNGYLASEPAFDVEPPFGKLLLTLFAWLGGYDGSVKWQSAGEPIPPSVPLFALRAGPAFFGAFLAPLLYVAGRSLGLSLPASLIAPAGALLDVCCLVEQRLLLTDGLLLLGVALHLAGTLSSEHSPPLSRGWVRRVTGAWVR